MKVYLCCYKVKEIKFTNFGKGVWKEKNNELWSPCVYIFLYILNRKNETDLILSTDIHFRYYRKLIFYWLIKSVQRYYKHLNIFLPSNLIRISQHIEIYFSCLSLALISLIRILQYILAWNDFKVNKWYFNTFQINLIHFTFHIFINIFI